MPNGLPLRPSPVIGVLLAMAPGAKATDPAPPSPTYRAAIA